MIETDLISVTAAPHIDIPLPSGVNNGVILLKLHTSVDDVELRGQVTDDDFTTVESAANYYHVDARISDAGDGESGADGGTYMSLAAGVGNAGLEGLWGLLDFSAVADAAYSSSFGFNIVNLLADASRLQRRYGGGSWWVSSVVNGLRLYPVSGNLTGEARVYKFPTT